MGRKKVLVLGNDPQINNIDFDRLDPSIITIGVNRIFLKYCPTYYFFHDTDILKELQLESSYLDNLIKNKSTIITSDWLVRQNKNKSIQIPPWVKLHHRSAQWINRFPDSVSTAIRIVSENYIDYSQYSFYIAGVGLTWTNPSHFWKELNYSNSLNKHDQAWYEKRFVRILKNFQTLQNIRFNFVNTNSYSRLNKIMRYESINTLYR